MTVLITGGGTGGHVYPALSIIPYLNAGHGPASDPARSPRPSDGPPLRYIGSTRGLERRIMPAGIPAHFFSMAPPTSPRGLILLAVATVRSLLVLLRNRPRVTFATGGYVSVPACIASWLLRVPIVLYLPDVVPGKAIRILVRLARRIAVSAPDSARYLPVSRMVVTGYPVRAEFFQASRDEARTRLGIPQDALVLFAFGASQGSRNINQALAACLPDLLPRCFVIHASGEQRLEEAKVAAGDLLHDPRYRLHPYLASSEMAGALAAADLALCRSGASVVGELPATGTPAILVPLPISTVHQRENAEFLARNGAALVLRDEEMPARLCSSLRDLLADPARLAAMAEATRSLARPDAAQRIAAVVEEAA